MSNLLPFEAHIFEKYLFDAMEGKAGFQRLLKILLYKVDSNSFPLCVENFSDSLNIRNFSPYSCYSSPRGGNLLLFNNLLFLAANQLA